MFKFKDIADKSNREQLVQANAANVTELQNAIKAGDTKTGKEIKAEMDTIQSQIDLLDSIGDVSIISTPKTHVGGKDSTKEFAAAVRNKFRDIAQESKDEDGGYIVPEDIQTRINQWKETESSLESLIATETVTRRKGSRTYQKKADMTGFEDIEEGGELKETDTPQFERVQYQIGDRGGWLPLTNDLMNDSDQNITQIVTQWIARKSNKTANNKIIGLVGTKSVKEIETTDEINKEIIVTLGADYRPTSSILTNDDGLYFFSTLKDTTGRPLLQPIPNETMGMYLAVGPLRIPLIVAGNKTISSDVKTKGKLKIPMICGDLKEAFKKYDRQKTSLLASNTATAGQLNAFTQNLTLIRAIERNDFKVIDKDAFVNLQMVVDDASVAGVTVSGS